MAYKDDSRIIYLSKCVVADIFCSACQLAFICASVWFNVTYCGNSYFLNAILLVMCWITVMAAASSNKLTIPEARRRLDELEAKESQ